MKMHLPSPQAPRVVHRRQLRENGNQLVGVETVAVGNS